MIYVNVKLHSTYIVIFFLAEWNKINKMYTTVRIQVYRYWLKKISCKLFTFSSFQ